MMQNGGSGSFEFVQKAISLISEGDISVIEWQKAGKIIFKQMIQAITYIHGQNVWHFAILRGEREAPPKRTQKI